MLETESLYKESGPDAAMGVYSDHLHSLLHDLTRLANTVPTIFKLLDDVQVSSFCAFTAHTTTICEKSSGIFSLFIIANNLNTVCKVGENNV